ncbi:unnamed protein product [Microthlaspi erraticum]|uniref:F-box domain-containing protein n=1 Tax=Microthlaspi erraticum TaxID=1685480 RepID=A0A6D2HLU9_9BRAS|nr:unnamed protein product [Microthlaspi erraticum]
MDRISSLPNEMICHIVSFLSAKEAAFATLLSKRWQNLFTIIPTLRFENSQGSFTDFLDGVLALPASSRIRKFSLIFSSPVEPARYVHVNRCLCYVLKSGVLDLEFNINAKEGYLLPSDIFTCKTVVKLKLGSGFGIDFLPENALLLALKTLFLRSVRFYSLCGCSFHKLLSACSVLEELTIYDVSWEKWQWSHVVSSPTLQRLSIRRAEYSGFDGSSFGGISFDTPSLVFLRCDDFVPAEYPSVNFDSLVEAQLDLILTVDHVWAINENDPITSDPTNLIRGLRNVQILDFTAPDTKEMFYLFREAIPVFESLHRLSFSTDDVKNCWPLFPVLLKKTPNLKTLVIEGPLHCAEDEEVSHSICECLSGYSCLLSCPVEVLKINRYTGAINELEHFKHFLGKLSCLKLVKVRARSNTWLRNMDELQITSDLLMIPRASVDCKIQVKFH